MKADTLKILYFRMLWVLGLKGIATIILYWEFTHGEIAAVILVGSCVIALILVKLDHAVKRTKQHSKYREFELEFLGLLLIIAPLFLLVMDNWNGSFNALLKLQSIRLSLLDVFLTLIISRALWIMRN